MGPRNTPKTLNMNILFWLYKSRINHRGLCPIMLRITLKGKRINVVTGIEIEPIQWDTDKQKVKGNSELHQVYNKQLLQLKTKAWKIYSDSLNENSSITLKDYLLGQEKKEKSILDAIDYQISNLRSRVGHDIAPSTVQKYVTIRRKVEDFIQHQFHKPDIPLSKVNHQFIFELDQYMRVEQKLQNNGVVKNMQQLKRVIKIALQNEWLVKDPFEQYRCKVIEPKRTFLTPEELVRLEGCPLPSDRLQRVRDVFVFSCYTGLAYADVSKLSSFHIQQINGQEWIILDRTKTKNQSTIPLLPKAKEILIRYHREENSKKLLPVISSQNLNKYLKELALEAGINKPFSFHAARHTFASTVTLNNGVDITSVSAMLGHKMIKTTQIYAKVNMNKIANDVQKLISQKGEE